MGFAFPNKHSPRINPMKIIFSLWKLPIATVQGTLRKGIAYNQKLSYSNYFGFR